MASRLVDAAEHRIAGLEAHHAQRRAVRTREPDGFRVLEEDGAGFGPALALHPGFDQEHGPHLDLDPAQGRHAGFAVRAHDEHFLPGAQFAQIGGLVVGQAGVGVHGSGIDPERPRGHVFVVFGFGVHQKGKGAGES